MHLHVCCWENTNYYCSKTLMTALSYIFHINNTRQQILDNMKNENCTLDFYFLASDIAGSGDLNYTHKHTKYTFTNLVITWLKSDKYKMWISCGFLFSCLQSLNNVLSKSRSLVFSFQWKNLAVLHKTNLCYEECQVYYYMESEMKSFSLSTVCGNQFAQRLGTCLSWTHNCLHMRQFKGEHSGISCLPIRIPIILFHQ